MIDKEWVAVGACIVIIVHLLKMMIDMVVKFKSKNECGMSEGTQLLVKQTHDIAIECKELSSDTNHKLDAHFKEVGSIAQSIKELAQTFRDCRQEDTQTQATQTEILRTLAQVLAKG